MQDVEIGPFHRVLRWRLTDWAIGNELVCLKESFLEVGNDHLSGILAVKEVDLLLNWLQRLLSSIMALIHHQVFLSD